METACMAYLLSRVEYQLWCYHGRNIEYVPYVTKIRYIYTLKFLFITAMYGTEATIVNL